MFVSFLGNSKPREAYTFGAGMLIGASRSEPHTSAMNGNLCVCMRTHARFISRESFTDLFQPLACATKIIFSSGQHMLLKMRKKAAECTGRWTENSEGADALQHECFT